MYQYQRIAEWLAALDREVVSVCERKRKRTERTDIQAKAYTTLDTMPTTPPPSNTAAALSMRPNTSSVIGTKEQMGIDEDAADIAYGSPLPKKRRVETTAIDADKTPTASSISSRLILRPKSKKRTRSVSPIKSVSSLEQLQKPIHVVALGNSSRDVLPEDVQGLYRDVRRRMNAGFVPAPVREEFLHACGSDEDLVTDSWFFEPALQTDQDMDEQKTTLIAQLHHLRTIQLVAGESVQLGRGEPSWNSKVHQPLLDMVCGDGVGMLDLKSKSRTLAALAQPYRVRAENVSAATITGDCIPRLRAEATPGGGSVPACSVTASTPSSVSEGDDMFRLDAGLLPDSHVHSRFGSKKVDFALVVAPAEETPLFGHVERVTHGLARRALAAADARDRDIPEPSSSINPTAYRPLLKNPVAVVIETKSITAPTDPLVQLGFMVAAMHRRLITLSSPGRPLPVRLVPTLPMISVVDHNWTLYFAADRRNRIVSSVSCVCRWYLANVCLQDIVGPVKMGSTETIDEIYKLYTSLSLLRNWVVEHYVPALEAWLADLSVDR